MATRASLLRSVVLLIGVVLSGAASAQGQGCQPPCEAVAQANPAAATAPGAMLKLASGQRLASQIEQWLQPHGWKLIWELEVDWLVPADVDMGTSDPLEALDTLSRWLHQEGRPVLFLAFTTNRVVVAKALASLSARP